jgi:GTP-binding protein of the ras superfamily involved in termination of M-phase
MTRSIGDSDFTVCGNDSTHRCLRFTSVVIKVGMVGDSQIGKTSLMVKYVEGSFDEDYIQTLGLLFHSSLAPCLMRFSGVNFMEKTISVRRTTITFSIWDLGGQREFVNMLPLVCNDAVAILFMFDLSRKSTLNSVKEWYRQARGFNKVRDPRSICTRSDRTADLLSIPDCDTVPDWYQIRHIRDLST